MTAYDCPVLEELNCHSNPTPDLSVSNSDCSNPVPSSPNETADKVASTLPRSFPKRQVIH